MIDQLANQLFHTICKGLHEPILDQAAVRIEPGDTFDSFAAKVHAAEHGLLPAVIARLSTVAAASDPAGGP